MLDINFIRENPDLFNLSMKNRGLDLQASHLIATDDIRRKMVNNTQSLQQKRNDIAKKISILKHNNSPEDKQIIEDAQKISEDVIQFAQETKKVEEEFESKMLNIPNIPMEDVPVGSDENDNVEIRKWGNIKEFNFKPIEHFALSASNKRMNFDIASKLSGSRFVILYNKYARLERALINFMLDINTKEFGYEEVSPPYLVKENAFFGTGQLPKFEGDFFKTTEGHYLIPTAEVALTNLVANSIILEKSLPLRYTAATPCFRSEAGSAGKDTRGMIRQHQFMKVELVSICLPEKSNEELERMVSIPESILQKLDLPYRVIVLCTGDMGFSAKKTYDIEVWLPGQSKYREISSCSNTGDFQARRMMARFKKEATSKNELVHTLNGSSLPIGRTLAAILENYQNEDGSVNIPEALVPYMDGVKKID